MVATPSAIIELITEFPTQIPTKIPSINYEAINSLPTIAQEVTIIAKNSNFSFLPLLLEIISAFLSIIGGVTTAIIILLLQDKFKKKFQKTNIIPLKVTKNLQGDKKNLYVMRLVLKNKSDYIAKILK